ncbi:hypothetical protein ACVW00_000599 [Marmoricola sp. URHA0025 HA25]
MRMKWLLVSGAALVVVLVLVIVLATRDSGPPPVASGPGVFRVKVQFQPNGGIRAPDALSYRGTTFKVGFGGASGSGDHLSANLVVTGPAGTVRQAAKYPRGATIELDGAKLLVRTIYAGGSDRDDLVDLQVVPAAG